MLAFPSLEVSASYYFLEAFLFKLKTELSYKEEWDFYIEDMYVGHSKFKVGYFSYPVSYTSRNSDFFSKKTFVQQSLFPMGRRGVGLLLNGGNWKSFNWKAGFQSTGLVEQSNEAFVLNASLFYNEKNRQAFVSYFHKSSSQILVDYLHASFHMPKSYGRDYPKIKSFHSLGVGTDFSYEIKSPFTFSFRGEFWLIKTKEEETFLVSYIYPSLRWNYLSFGMLLGGVFDKTQDDDVKASFKDINLEYVLKGELYLTEEFTFRVERFKEQKQNKSSWAFSLFTNFKI